MEGVSPEVLCDAPSDTRMCKCMWEHEGWSTVTC
jgi:hypothetical protein